MPATRKTARSKGPRSQHPRLVGFSSEENHLVERAASKADAPTNVYIREAALYQAREDLGLKHPAGE
jgi:hypothetical protein